MILPVRGRLTAWYTGLTLAVLAAAAVVIVGVQDRLGVNRLDDELARVAATVESVVRHEIGEGLPLAGAAAEASREVAVPGVWVVVTGPGGAVLAGWGDGLPAAYVPQPGAPPDAEIGGRGYRLSQRTVRSDAGPFLVNVIAPTGPLERQHRELLQALGAGLLAALVVAAVGGWVVGRQALRPLTRMAHEATAITERSESIRLRVPHPDDELGRLAVAFNALLDRLSSALHGQRQFMADASHQMRTPVSVLRTTSQVMLRKPAREEREYRESLTIVGEQSARLARLVDAMFLLARAEAGGRPVRREPLYLDELVGECARAVAVLAAEHDVRVVTDGDTDLAFLGDDELLRHMVVNLLENAVRHTRALGEVRAVLIHEGDRVVLRVHDCGHGVSPADRDRIFDRFVSLDGGAGGTGLGLPMARWIAQSHGGQLILERSGAEGSCFAAILPATPAEADPAPAAVPA